MEEMNTGRSPEEQKTKCGIKEWEFGPKSAFFYSELSKS